MNKTLSRRGFLGTTAAAATVPLLASCSSGGSYGQALAGSVPKKYKKRTVTVAWVPWTTHKKTLDKFASDFNDSQEDVYAQFLYINGYQAVNEKLSAAIQAKKVPDIAALGSGQWWTFMLDEMVEPLDDHFTGNFTADSYYKVFLSEGQVNGKTYWVPFGRSTPMVYYNKDVFDKAGLPDRAPKTWKEMREWGSHLKGMDSANGQPLKLTAFELEDTGWLFDNPLWSFGGSFSDGLDVTVGGAKAIDAAQFEFDMINKDKTAYASKTFDDDFTGGLTSMCIESTATLTSITNTAKFGVGTGFCPGEETTAVPTGGGGISMMKYISDDRKSAAAKFLDYLAAPEQVAAWSVATGYIPCTMAATKTKTIQDLWNKDPRYKTASDQLKVAKFEDLLKRIMPVTGQLTETALEELYSDASASPAKIMKDLANKVKQQVEKTKSKYDKVIGKS